MVSLVVCLLIWSQTRAQFPAPNFELVESIPVETSLDNPDIRNTTIVWQEMINRAHTTIDMEHFYLSNAPNSALDTILKALRTAHLRGVKIRLILDARMSRTYPESITWLRQNGIAIRFLSTFNQLGGVQHAKMMVVDSQIVFIGSQNCDWRALTHIHELGLKIENAPLAHQLLILFEDDWQACIQPNYPTAIYTGQYNQYQLSLSTGELLCFYPTASPLNYFPNGFRWDEEALLELLHGAKRSIDVQLLSYATGEEGKSYRRIDDALRAAAGRGVQIRLLIADWATASAELKALKELASVPNISVRLTNIPAYSGGYIPYARVEHCKYCVVDDSLSWLGTSNWGRSYFYSSRNLGLVIKNPTLNQRLRQIFNKSWDSPYAFVLEPTKSYPRKFFRETTTPSPQKSNQQ